MEQLPKIVSRRLQTVSPGVHPDANLLVGFAEKSLLASEQAQVLDHLAACAVCREVVTRALPEGALEPAAVANPAGRRTWFHGAVRWAALAACVVVAGAVVISRSQFLQRTPTSVATYKAPAEVDKVEVARNEEQPASSGSPAPAVRARESENKIALSKAAPVASPRRDETPQRQQLADVSPGVSEEKRKPDADQNGLPTYHGAGSRSGGAVDISQAAAAPVSSPVADDAKANKKEFSADKSMKVPVAANEAVQVEAATTVVSPPPAAKPANDSGITDHQQAKGGSGELTRLYKAKDGYAGTAGAAVGSLHSGLRFPTPRWQLSSEGKLLKSSDLGRSWQPVPLGEKAIFQALSVTGREVWVGGAQGSLFYSPNAGDAWTQVKPSASGQTLTADITAIEFTDPQHGKLTTSNHQIWTTNDGGHAWHVETR